MASNINLQLIFDTSSQQFPTLFIAIVTGMFLITLVTGIKITARDSDLRLIFFVLLTKLSLN